MRLSNPRGAKLILRDEIYSVHGWRISIGVSLQRFYYLVFRNKQLEDSIVAIRRVIEALIEIEKIFCFMLRTPECMKNDKY